MVQKYVMRGEVWHEITRKLNHERSECNGMKEKQSIDYRNLSWWDTGMKFRQRPTIQIWRRQLAISEWIEREVCRLERVNHHLIHYE